MKKEFMSLVNSILPPWACVIEGREVEAVLDTIAKVSQESLLEGVPDWISHREYLLVWAEIEESCFKVKAEYRGSMYEAVVEVIDSGLSYLKPWEEAMV